MTRSLNLDFWKKKISKWPLETVLKKIATREAPHLHIGTHTHTQDLPSKTVLFNRSEGRGLLRTELEWFDGVRQSSLIRQCCSSSGADKGTQAGGRDAMRGGRQTFSRDS